MAPSSGRRTRTRHEAGLEATPAPEPTVASSTRSSPKKRKVNSGHAEPPVRTFEAVSALSPEQLQSMVIPRLALPDHDVLVASDESNEKIAQRTKGAPISAFARIAGPTWTVYMREERLVIGRAPDLVRSSDANGSLTSPTPAPEDQVQIDLGPNKIVSRQHAVIEFGSSWQISVTGRNAAKVDNVRVDQGRNAPLHAGSVIEIGGCQMMFLLPDDSEFHIARPILEQLGLVQPERETSVEQSRAPQRRSSHSVDQSIPAELANFDNRASILSGSTIMNRPSTPPPPMPRPYQHGHASPPNISKSMSLETMEAIDYSLESMKDFKPPHSYAMLIGMAVLSAEDQQLSLAAIYQWIKDRFAYFRHAHPGWQNSIRHNLSLNKYFNKVPRRTDEPGKGMKWTINQEDRAEFIEKHIKQPHKNARQPSSGPNTPSADTNSRQMSQAMPRPNGTTQVLENIGMAPVHVRDQAGDQLHSGVPRGTTPPSFMNPGIGRLAYTPDRGTRNGYAIPTSPSPSGSNPPANPYYLNPGPTSHGPARSQPRAFAQTQPVFHSDTTGNILGMHSPGQTMLTSTGYLDDHPFSINSLMTPAPREQQPTLQPASAMRMPSSFMGPTSSPAPFWKFMSDTPQNFPLFASPQQRMPGSKGDLQSSSPPPDDQRRDFGSPVRMNASQHEHHGQAAGAVPVADSLSTNGNKAAGLGINTSAAGGAVLDDDLEGGIDLANTWQTIGQYHEKLSRASGMATAK